MCSCKTKKATQSYTPYQVEVSYSPEATDRVESVRQVDSSERTMYRFYVIIGSFRSIDNARQYNVDLVRKGFNPVILENEEGLFRISVGGYDDERAARTRIADIRASYAEHRDVWLLIRRQ